MGGCNGLTIAPRAPSADLLSPHREEDGVPVMKSFLMLIVVAGLLAIGWVNREKLLGAAGPGVPGTEGGMLSSLNFLRGNAPATPHPARAAMNRASTILPRHCPRQFAAEPEIRRSLQGSTGLRPRAFVSGRVATGTR